MEKALAIAVLSMLLALNAFAQPPATSSFRSIVKSKLKERKLDLAMVCPETDVVADRVFRDYGAIFVSKGTSLPRKCVFDTEPEVQAFQALAEPYELNVGGVTITLQRAAMAAFEAALDDAAKMRLSITPRGGPSASMRSYAKTVELWKSRFEPALKHWTARGSIKKADADTARKAPIHEQVAMVLEWEKKGFWFSKDLSKSILYSVAVPGASQHVFMLALDVEQFADKRVRDILAHHGWFQTVKSDLPHFTYLGVKADQLRSLGLIDVPIAGQTFWIPNMENDQ